MFDKIPVPESGANESWHHNNVYLIPQLLFMNGKKTEEIYFRAFFFMFITNFFIHKWSYVLV